MAFSLVLSLIHLSGRKSLIEFILSRKYLAAKTLCCVIETVYAALGGEWRGHIRDRSILSKYITMSKHKQILFINKLEFFTKAKLHTKHYSTLQMMQTCYQWAMAIVQMCILCIIYWISHSVFFFFQCCGCLPRFHITVIVDVAQLIKINYALTHT